MEKFLTNDDVNYFKRYSDEFDRLKIDPKLSIKCISTLFPVFAKCVNGANIVMKKLRILGLK